MKNPVYWGVIIVLALLSFVEFASLSSHSRKKEILFNRIYIIMCAGLLLLFFQINEFSVVDAGNYNTYWWGMTNSWNDVMKQMDKGFCTLILICKCFVKTYKGFSSILYVCTLVPFFFVIYKKSKYKIMSLFLFLVFYSNMILGIKRLALASAIIVLAWYFLDKGKMFIALIMILIAPTIHIAGVSAFLLLVLKWGKKISPSMIVTLGSAVAFFTAVFVLPRVAIWYRGGGYEKETYNGGIPYLIVMIMIYILTQMMYPGYLEDRSNRWAYKTMVCAIPIQVMALRISTVVRMGYMYFLYIMLVLPNMLYEVRGKERYFVAMAVICGGIAWIAYTGVWINLVDWNFVPSI